MKATVYFIFVDLHILFSACKVINAARPEAEATSSTLGIFFVLFTLLNSSCTLRKMVRRRDEPGACSEQ